MAGDGAAMTNMTLEGPTLKLISHTVSASHLPRAKERGAADAEAAAADVARLASKAKVTQS